MSYLKLMQIYYSDQYKIYVPEIICLNCDNKLPGDSPPRTVEECENCEVQLGSSCCGAKSWKNSFVEEENIGVCSKCLEWSDFNNINERV